MSPSSPSQLSKLQLKRETDGRTDLRVGFSSRGPFQNDGVPCAIPIIYIYIYEFIIIYIPMLPMLLYRHITL